MLAKREWLRTLTLILKGLGFSSLLLLSLAGFAATEGPPKKNGAPPQVGVSVPRGFYEQPFILKLTPPGDAALIRYTDDGSEPTLASGRDYGAPLSITNTTILRAAAFENGARVSAVATHSYIFLDQVLRQPKNPPGFPSGPSA